MLCHASHARYRLHPVHNHLCLQMIFWVGDEELVMARLGRFKGCVAGGAIAALVLTVGGGPAQAEEAVAAAEEVTASTTEAVAEADQLLSLEAFTATAEGFTAVDGTVAVDGATVTATVGVGMQVELSLPVDTTADPQLTDH
uniref:Uncharacterized protein n=1 Tax=Kocuria rosea subsp. polaris TaxID=136273 RepID=A0A0A6VQ77_KOCRO|nr:hypothetical protein GY22_14830 [Kocuria polaris]